MYLHGIKTFLKIGFEVNFTDFIKNVEMCTSETILA